MQTPVDRRRPETIAVHAGESRPGPEGSVVFPIYQGTVYRLEADTGYHDIQYLRLNSTPSQRYLHAKLAALEQAEAAVATSSGMAALTATFLTTLRQGDHLLAGDCLYGGTYDFIVDVAADLGLSWTFVDVQKPETWKEALRPNTRVFLVETITNPLMRVPRLREVVAFAREHCLTSVIDNTFATPIQFRPIPFGFDLVFHSATKYLNGHADIVAGCVLGSKDRVEKVRRRLNLLGGSLDPHAGFLLARGIKTLALRIRAHAHNALALARFLAEHPAVQEVNYPGLTTHPDHAQAREFLSGFGGMLSFRVKGGLPAAERFLRAVTIPHYAPSLGGTETLVIRPAASSHAGMRREDRERMGIHEDLIRVSCGIESAEDLVEDFRQALEAGATAAAAS
jgi:cystathionine gamma-synthase/cystathionine gamma-lyase/cystathionine beta-lyase